MAAAQGSGGSKRGTRAGEGDDSTGGTSVIEQKMVKEPILARGKGTRHM